MPVIIAIVLLALSYVLILRGRTRHKDLPALKGWYYAHRGLHSEGVPENSIAAFLAARDAGYGVELDVHLMRDGNLAVIHDHSLKRTAGVDIQIEHLTSEELHNYHLEGTQERIPLFSEVLDLYAGKAPLIVELKPTTKNHAALCRAACDMLSEYKGAYCVESFDPRCVAWLRKNRKEVVRGQLTENFFRSDSKLPGMVKFLMKYNFFNAATRPDFIAYRFADRKNFSNFLCRKLWGLQGVTWTIRSKEDFDVAVSEGWIPIFENFKP